MSWNTLLSVTNQFLAKKPVVNINEIRLFTIFTHIIIIFILTTFLMFQPPEDNHSFVSLSSIQSRASTLTNNSRRRTKFPHRIIDNFQKWAFKSSSQKTSHTSSISSLNSSRLPNDNELSDSCDLTSFTISEREESIVSEVIRNRKQLESLVCGHSDFVRNHDSLSIDPGIVVVLSNHLRRCSLLYIGFGNGWTGITKPSSFGFKWNV